MVVFESVDTKTFMERLLLTDTFDRFVLVEADIITAIRTDIDGTLNKDFDNGSSEKFIGFSSVRPIILSLIKGEKPPLFFKLILAMPNSGIIKYIDQHRDSFSSVVPTALFLNIKFENGALSLTSGSSASGFDMEKIVDKLWDSSLNKFLVNKNLIQI